MEIAAPDRLTWLGEILDCQYRGSVRGETGMVDKTTTQVITMTYKWRRGRDSNPRYSCPHNRFRVCRLKPDSATSPFENPPFYCCASRAARACRLRSPKKARKSRALSSARTPEVVGIRWFSRVSPRTAEQGERDIRDNGAEIAAPDRLTRSWRNPRLPVSGGCAGGNGGS